MLDNLIFLQGKTKRKTGGPLCVKRKEHLLVAAGPVEKGKRKKELKETKLKRADF